LNQQRTIANEVELSDRGLFTGQPAKLRFRPAGPNTGVVFVRTDLPEPVRIPAHVTHLAARSRRTALRNGTVAVETIEHCMAAVGALGIDNLLIELHGNELPGFDGSCKPYAEALHRSGIKTQPAERRVFIVKEPLYVKDGEASLALLPGHGDGLEIIYQLDYGPGPIGRQWLSMELTPEAFMSELADSRTFLLEDEARQFQAQGLGKHLSTNEILVIGQDGVLGENRFNRPDECVRHKVVDLIGDLTLLGMPIRGTVVAHKSGHPLNHRLVKKLYQRMQLQQRSQQMLAHPVLDIRQIQRILPHRYPFLLVDRVIEFDGDRRAVGIKNVTYNEHFFQGHFPGTPIMPGVLIIEAMAQMSGILFGRRLENTGKLAVLLSIDKVKIRRPVVPGDQLVIEAEAVRVKTRTGYCRCKAMVGGQLAAEAQIRFMLVDANSE